MDDEILGLLALTILLIFGVFLFNLRREGFNTNTSNKLKNLVRIRTEPLPEGEEATVVRPGLLRSKEENIEVGPSDEPGAWTGGSADYKNNYSRQADKRREQAKRLTNTDLLENDAVQEIGKRKAKGLGTKKVSTGNFEPGFSGSLEKNIYLKDIAKSSSHRINFEKEQREREQAKSVPEGLDASEENFAPL
jgi:hypothetical protein